MYTVPQKAQTQTKKETAKKKQIKNGKSKY